MFLKQSFKYEHSKNNLIKVIEDKICSSKTKYDSLIYETIQNVCNIKEQVTKQIDKLRNVNHQNHLTNNPSGTTRGTKSGNIPRSTPRTLYGPRFGWFYNREKFELPSKTGQGIGIAELKILPCY